MDARAGSSRSSCHLSSLDDTDVANVALERLNYDKNNSKLEILGNTSEGTSRIKDNCSDDSTKGKTEKRSESIHTKGKKVMATKDMDSIQIDKMEKLSKSNCETPKNAEKKQEDEDYLTSEVEEEYESDEDSDEYESIIVQRKQKSNAEITKISFTPEAENDEGKDKNHELAVSTVMSEGDDENPEVPLPVSYKDKRWLSKISKTCQVCDKIYSNCKDASNCITTRHRRIRCYMCFTYYRNMEKFISHVDAVHRQEELNGIIRCPFCDNPTSINDITFHVLYCHIIPLEKLEKNLPIGYGKDIDKTET